MGQNIMRAVVVHAGARDAYQVALGLAERRLLEALVTDLYWPQAESWARAVNALLPRRMRSLLLQRSRSGLHWAQIQTCAVSGLKTLLSEKIPGVSFSRRREIMRHGDFVLGEVAGRLAKTRKTKLVSYSYTGYQAFASYGRPGILFQAHPHPATMRRILRAELEKHPDCADSLLQEWELSLPDADYDRLVVEAMTASDYIAASSFTKQSLIENGVSEASISVVPYGVDLQRFQPAKQRASGHRLELLFVGRINQRKGVKYLLEALRLLNSSQVHLTVCGRVVDDLALFCPFESIITIRPSVSARELCEAYRSADLFVFPSVAEGFGQVLLEALASGLPILSTTRTAAPDLITEGVEGFIVEPCDPQAIADRLRWAIDNRDCLAAMGHAARACAERFTWERFREETSRIISSC